MKKILIIGGGPQQLAAIRSVRTLRWHSVVIDKNPHAVGTYEADESFMVDIKSREEVVAFAMKYHEHHALDGVCVVGTDFSQVGAYVAEKLSLPSIPSETAYILTDKGKMRTQLRRAKIAVPDFVVLDATNLSEALHEGEKFIQNNDPPYVIKPAKNMGGRGVQRIEKGEEWEEKLHYALSFSDDQMVIVERFIEGKEYSVDALVDKGRVHLAGLADRHIALSPFFVELGHSLPSELSAQHVEDIQDTLQRAAVSLNIRQGALKGDVFIENDRVVIGELAGRLSGGFMSGWTIPLMSGIPLVKEVIKMSAGLPLRHHALMATRSRYVAERAIISIPGKIERIEGLTEVIEHSACEHVFLSANKGDTVTVPRNNTEKIGNIIVAESTRWRCRHTSQQLLQKIAVVLSPSHTDTEKFLFSMSEELPSIGPVIRWQKMDIPPPRIRHEGIPVYQPSGMIESIDTSWSGQSFDEIYQEALQRKYLYRVSHPSRSLGNLFFQAVQRGGLQAIRYMADSLRKDNSENVVARWQEYAQ